MHWGSILKMDSLGRQGGGGRGGRGGSGVGVNLYVIMVVINA